MYRLMKGKRGLVMGVANDHRLPGRAKAEDSKPLSKTFLLQAKFLAIEALAAKPACTSSMILP